MRFIFGYKIYENVQQAKSILKKNGVEESDNDFVSLRKMLKGYDGYLGWFTKMLFDENVPYSELENLFNDIITHPEIINSLPNPLITYKTWEELLDDKIRTSENVYIRRIYNSFPSTQKDFFNLNKLSVSDRSLLLDLYKLSDRKNFLRKVSRYKTKPELITSLKAFVNGDRKSDYESILKRVNASRAKIYLEDKSNEIIICKVNYGQITALGSDTSWCIVPSESTFNSYVNEFESQYIIFLTDETDNTSKIGVTYGFGFRTAHLKNDTSISENNLEKLLNERETSLSILKLSKDMVLSNLSLINNTSVGSLIRRGFTKDEIVKHKKVFVEKDTEHFTGEEILRYGLHDRMPITNTILGSHDITWLLDNIDRYIDKLSVKILTKLKPSPRTLETLIEMDVLDASCLEWVNMIKKYKSSVKENTWRFIEYNVIGSRGRNSTEKDIDALIYGLMYCGVNSYSYTLSDLVDMLPSNNIGPYHLDKFKSYLVGAGFDIEENVDDSFEMILKFLRGRSSFSTIESELIDVLPDFPFLKDKIKSVIKPKIEQSSYSNAELSIIKKYYKDIYDEIDHYTKLNKKTKEWEDIIPSTRYQNYGISRHGARKELPTPQELYDEFWPILKDRKWGGYGYSTDSVWYMIHILCKTNNYDKLSEMNFSWNTESVGKVIRSALGILDYNGQDVIYDTFRLTDDEKIKLFQYLQTHIKDKIKYKYSNVVVDIEMERYKVFSLLYYLYNWGFNTYLKLVEKSKNHYKQTWEKDDKGHDISKHQNVRINYLDHIFKYLIKEKKWSEFDNLLQTVMGWKMSKPELKLTQDYLRYVSNSPTEELKNIIFQYLRPEQIQDIKSPKRYY